MNCIHNESPFSRRIAVLLIVLLLLTQFFVIVLRRPFDRVGPDAGLYHPLACDVLRASSWLDPSLCGTRAYMPPLYPVFLAGLYRISDAPLFIKLVQFGLFLGTMGLTALIARRAGLRPETAVLALVFLAAYPSTGDGIREMGYEVLLTFLLAAMLACVLSGADPGHRAGRRAAVLALAGIAAGLAALAQTKVLVVAGVAALWLAWVERKRKGPGWAVLFLAVAALTVSPWTIRNWLVYHELIPVSTNGGLAFFSLHNEQANGKQVYWVPGYERMFSSDSPRESERWWYRVSLRDIREHPLRNVKNGAKSVFYTMFEPNWTCRHAADRLATRRPGLRSVVLGAGYALTILTMLVAFAGIVRLLRDPATRRNAVLLVLPIAMFALLHAVFFGGGRYRIPLLPLVAIFQAAAVAGWMQRRRQGSVFAGFLREMP